METRPYEAAYLSFRRAHINERIVNGPGMTRNLSKRGDYQDLRILSLRTRQKEDRGRGIQ